MQNEWSDIGELDKVIAEAEYKISECRKEMLRLESHLSWLNSERESFLTCSLPKKKGKTSIYSKPHSFNLQRKNFPIVPIRQLSESGGRMADPTSDTVVSKSSETQFSSTSSLINKNCTSCSVEDTSVSESSSPSRTSSTKGHKFSSYELKFLKKLTSYAKSPSKWNGSNPKLSISSMDEILSESCNSLTTSTDDLDIDKGVKSEGANITSSDTAIRDSSQSSLKRSRVFYSKKREQFLLDGSSHDICSSDHSGASDDISLDNISNSDSSGCHGIPHLDENAINSTSTRTSSSSVSLKSEKLGKKFRGMKGMIRSKSSVFHDEDSLSQASFYSSYDYVDKLSIVENFLNLERNYVEKLQLLVENFEQALRDHSKDSLTLRHNINTVFHHPCHLLMIHKSFLIAAQHRVKKVSGGGQVPIIFGDLFLEMVNQFKVYIEYAKDFSFTMETLATIESQYIQTKELIDKIGVEVCISLPDLFHIPLRQVETYQHLISNVRQQLLGSEASSESIILEEAEYKLEEITANIDRIMSDVRKRNKSSRKRELIHKGMMAGQNEKSVLKMRYLFLYNDVLVCARMSRTSDHASLYLPKWHLPLSDILLPLSHDPPRSVDTIQLRQLKMKIKEIQKLLKEEEANILQDLTKGAVSKRMRGFRKQRMKALKDSLTDKIDEYHVMHMNLPFKIISKRGKTYTMHIHGEKERDEWMRQIQTQLNKVPSCTANISLTATEVEALLERYTKLRKDSSIAKLDVDNDDEVLYDGVLLVQVICGTDLGEVGTKPDVYCTLEADCNGVMCKKTKTKIAKASVNPIWDETICIPAQACQFLRIRAYGKKKFTAPVEIGLKLITLLDHNLEDNSPKPLAVNLQPKGQIKLTVQLLSQEMARQRKESQHQTFGVALEELALIEGQKIPPIIHACFREIEKRGITEEGIYRISGIMGEIRQLKSAFDECARNGEILASEAEVNVVAGVVKLFFRELPKPLFPVEMFYDFVELLDSKEESDREKMMNAFGDIPEPNISVIVRLIQHIKYIAEYQPKNKMDLNNLCLLFGPNVVKPPNSNGEPTCEMLTNTTRQQVGILKFFCEKQLSELQELHGDEEGLRPIIATPQLSTNLTAPRSAPLLRHASVPTPTQLGLDDDTIDDVITEEEDVLSPPQSERCSPDPQVSPAHPPQFDLPSLSVELSNGLILSPVEEGSSETPAVVTRDGVAPSGGAGSTASCYVEETVTNDVQTTVENFGNLSMNDGGQSSDCSASSVQTSRSCQGIELSSTNPPALSPEFMKVLTVTPTTEISATTTSESSAARTVTTTTATVVATTTAATTTPAITATITTTDITDQRDICAGTVATTTSRTFDRKCQYSDSSIERSFSVESTEHSITLNPLDRNQDPESGIAQGERQGVIETIENTDTATKESDISYRIDEYDVSQAFLGNGPSCDNGQDVLLESEACNVNESLIQVDSSPPTNPVLMESEQNESN